jgi:hypothetical protein
MTDIAWLLDDSRPLDDAAIAEIERELPGLADALSRGAVEAQVPPLAVLLHDLVIHDVRKWWGGANIRVDALVVHGHGASEEPSTFYMPGTFRFPNVRNDDYLQIDESGLLVFLGRPLHFLDMYITVSRDRSDSDDLATLLSKKLSSYEVVLDVPKV